VYIGIWPTLMGLLAMIQASIFQCSSNLPIVRRLDSTGKWIKARREERGESVCWVYSGEKRQGTSNAMSASESIPT